MKIKVKGTLIETNDILTISEIKSNTFFDGKYYKFIIKFQNQSELEVVIQGADYTNYDHKKPPSDKDKKERIQKIYDFVCNHWIGEGVLIPEIN